MQDDFMKKEGPPALSSKLEDMEHCGLQNTERNGAELPCSCPQIKSTHELKSQQDSGGGLQKGTELLATKTETKYCI
jgi:hypothetical protein